MLQVYSPLRHYGLDKKGMKLGVVGLGGLGHMCAPAPTLNLNQMIHSLGVWA